ncbi:MAG: Peptide deformylase [Candidatus Uhrbacteria bacterium GW2011_GWF2_41_16]|jgi:peptide deformylase|uniref:Peptide deformylase n=1 Tax=Candidatus Uhrbacteria bacterium GW2011_GWF2_41_16 TaxID=1618997 RepID=A0A0G0V866_9BACT|nr:MAG: Peptide deformylase [Candidatus Uhrbacteria bacterium GW2011_GWA2_41_10]KKR97124.1 MAG: Peptide deformylase [Candidatus Uhrbacteria bacterium GW2011_GWF2_41_16]HBP00294.1 peptide deformylase [Candidatus Uhrbacteria bacterium]
MLPILHDPNPELREISDPFDLTSLASPDVQDWLDELVETMKQADGIGIAAPQTGTKKRVIVVQIKNEPHVFINPKIISRSLQTIESEEGCLSVPNVFGMVQRSKRVKVKAWNRKGEKIIIKTDPAEAIIFQHEIDHLDGILFIDKVDHFTRPPRL